MRYARNLAAATLLALTQPRRPATIYHELGPPVTITVTTDKSGINLDRIYRCADLIATLDPGDDFQSMRLLMTPPNGRAILPTPLWGRPPNYGPPNPAFPEFPGRFFDTFLDDRGSLLRPRRHRWRE
jgi:hypothetical protein